MTSKTKAPKPLDDFADEHTAARFTENQEIARQLRAVRGALAEKEKALADAEKLLGVYEALDATPLKPPTWEKPKPGAKGHVAIPSLLLTDIHWDEVVRPAEVDGINKYNRRIAEQRVRRAFERAITVSRDYLAGVTYEGFQLFLGGDLISGVIHEELKETNEAQVMDSVLSILDPLAAGIHLLAAEFGRVHVAAVVGNHGRNSKKPRAKQRVYDSFDWLVYKFLQRELAAESRITMQVADAADAHVQIYGVRYLLTHGDQFSGGSGISGALSPLLLGAHRKTRRQSAAGKPYDIMVMGHFHQSIMFPAKGLIVGGSVIGYNEYAYIGNLEPEPPQCAYWLTTPQHGVTFSAPIFVQDRKAEGW